MFFTFLRQHPFIRLYFYVSIIDSNLGKCFCAMRARKLLNFMHSFNVTFRSFWSLKLFSQVLLLNKSTLLWVLLMCCYIRSIWEIGNTKVKLSTNFQTLTCNNLLNIIRPIILNNSTWLLAIGCPWVHHCWKQAVWHCGEALLSAAHVHPGAGLHLRLSNQAPASVWQLRRGDEG